MCENLNKKITRSKDLSEGGKEVLKMVVKEFKKVDARMAVLEERFDKVETRLSNMEDRFGHVEETNAQILAMMNHLSDKLTVDEVEKKAAQMDLIRKLFVTKTGWIILAVLMIAFCCGGIAISYFLEHSREVAEVAQSIR